MDVSVAEVNYRNHHSLMIVNLVLLYNTGGSQEKGAGSLHFIHDTPVVEIRQNLGEDPTVHPPCHSHLGRKSSGP